MKKRLMAVLAAAARVGSSKDETSEAGFDLPSPPLGCYRGGITAPKGCSGISNLRKAHRRTT